MKGVLAFLLVTSAALIYSAQQAELPIFTDITKESGITVKR